MQDTSIELQRCRDSDQVQEVTDILKSSCIPYELKSTALNFDLSSIGSGSNAEVVIRVPAEVYDEARQALESEYINVALPDDHYLLSSTDDEIIEIVGNASDWNAFDVAHARKIMVERNLDAGDVDIQKSLSLARLKEGKKAPFKLIAMGWIFTALGGLIGLGIAWSLCTMKEKTPHGEFYTYDEASRKIGKDMGGVAFIVSVITIFMRLGNSN